MPNLIENLNHMLSLENGSIDRIVSRIDHTPIKEVKERLKQHLGPEQLSPINILGYSMNLAAKITSMTGPDKISIGDNVYKSLNSKMQRDFHEVSITDSQWKYINYGTDSPYKVYTMNS
jgi:adenylate cyclase